MKCGNIGLGVGIQFIIEGFIVPLHPLAICRTGIFEQIKQLTPVASIESVPYALRAEGRKGKQHDDNQNNRGFMEMGVA